MKETEGQDTVQRLTPMSLRERAGLTQQQVAVAMSVRVSTVSDWERGVHEPRLALSDVQKLCQIYECSLDELVSAFKNTKRKVYD